MMCLVNKSKTVFVLQAIMSNALSYLENLNGVHIIRTNTSDQSNEILSIHVNTM